MGEIADMMLDGTMDPETGEYNFDGEDGPGYPMTGAQAAEFKKATAYYGGSRKVPKRPYTLTPEERGRFEAIGVTVHQHDSFHWTARSGGKVLASWWPHIGKFAMGGGKSERGNQMMFLIRLRSELANIHKTNREQERKS